MSRSRWKAVLYAIPAVIANLCVTAFLLTPFLALFHMAIQTERSLMESFMTLIPTELTFENIGLALFGSKDFNNFMAQPGFFLFIGPYRNSLIYASATTVLNVLIGCPAAYAMARFRHRWTQLFMYANLGSRMVPLIVLMIPLFLTLRALGLMNTRTGIILTMTGYLLPYTIWILHSFFVSLPHELEDAARVDGCSRFGSFLRVMLPLSRPGIATAGVIVFVLAYQEFMVPLVITTKTDLYPASVGLAYRLPTAWPTMFSAIVLGASLPPVLVALLLQRYVVRGIRAGALKG